MSQLAEGLRLEEADGVVAETEAHQVEGVGEGVGGH